MGLLLRLKLWYNNKNLYIVGERRVVMGLYYLQTNIICIVVLLVIIVALHKRGSTMTTRRLSFMRLVGICMLICLSDIFAWSMLGTQFPKTAAVLQLSNMLYDFGITWEGYAWLEYVELSTDTLENSARRRSWVKMLPLLVMGALLLTNPLTDFVFVIDETNNYTRGAGTVIHWIVSWGYMFYATFKVWRAMRRCYSRTEKYQLVPMLTFVVPPTIAALLQMVCYGLTSMQCGVTLAILIISFSYLSEEISKDTLTGMNNRRAMENFLIERLNRSGKEPLTVFMCDVDRFKVVNDTYGHAAGDLVLRRVADALKHACAGEAGFVFLCRYGGDEFVMCSFELNTEEQIASFAERIRAAVNEVDIAEYEGVSLGISIGYASGLCEGYADVETLLEQADSTMYHAKKLFR